MNTINYIPGQGFKDGYSDRMAGRANKSVTQAQSQPYWSEYHQGYAEAEKKIVFNAAQGMNESKIFLTEDTK